MTPSLREERELEQLRESGKRGVMFLPGLGTAQDAWREWRAVFEQAGHPTFAPAAEELPAGEFVSQTTGRMLQHIDQMGLEPHVIGVGYGALIALRIADDCGAASTVAIGGPAISIEALGVEPDSGLSGRMLLIGGEHDPELPVEAMRERFSAYAEDASPDAVRLILRPGSAQTLAFGEDWRDTADAALAFVGGPTRRDRARRFFSDIWSSLIH